MNLRRASAAGMRFAKSPITRRAVAIGEKVAGVAGVLGVPGASAVEKGLDVAGRILEKVAA